MELLFTVLVYLAFAGALASWIAGAVFYARTLRTLGADGPANWLGAPAVADQGRGRRTGRAGQQIAGRLLCLPDDCLRGILGFGQPSSRREIETPMPVDVLMPALSPTMEKGNLSKWMKAEGDKG